VIRNEYGFQPQGISHRKCKNVRKLAMLVSHYYTLTSSVMFATWMDVRIHIVYLLDNRCSCDKPARAVIVINLFECVLNQFHL
jgi:hypothetical protein